MALAPDTTRPREDAVSARVWLLCGLLFLATVLNYLDRQVLALTAEKIMAEFHLTKESFGEVIAAFRYAYGIFQIAGGWLVDARGSRVIYPLAVGLWSLAGVLTAFAASARMLMGFRFALGIGEAFNWPSALQVTKRLVPAKDRPLANGIFNSGAAAGAMLAPLIVTTLSLRFGWRAAFVVTGALGGLWIMAWLIFTRGWKTQLGGSGASISEAGKVMWRIVTRRGFWLLLVSAIIVNGVNYFLADWIPLYLKTERGFSFAAGNALSIIVYGSLEVGNILVGLFVRRMVAAGSSVAAAKRRALAGSCVLMSSAALAGMVGNRYVAIALLMFTALGVAGFLVIYLTLVQDLEPDHVGAAAGLLGGAGNLAYGFFSPYIGRLADLQQTTLTFGLIGLLPWLALLAILSSLRERQ